MDYYFCKYLKSLPLKTFLSDKLIQEGSGKKQTTPDAEIGS